MFKKHTKTLEKPRAVFRKVMENPDRDLYRYRNTKQNIYEIRSSGFDQKKKFFTFRIEYLIRLIDCQYQVDLHEFDTSLMMFGIA